MSDADAFSGIDRALETFLLVLVLLWTVYVLVESFGFEQFFAWVLPVLAGIPLLALVLIQLSSLYLDGVQSALRWVRLDESTNIAEADRASSGRDAVVFIAAVLGYVAVAMVAGFFLAIPVFLFGFFYLYDSFDWKRSVLVTVAVWFTTSFVFGTVFAVPGVNFGPFSAFELGLFS